MQLKEGRGNLVEMFDVARFWSTWKGSHDESLRGMGSLSGAHSLYSVYSSVRFGSLKNSESF